MFVLKSLSDVSTAAPSSVVSTLHFILSVLWTSVACTIVLDVLVFSFLTNSVSLCLVIGEFSPFTLKVIIERVGLMPTL